MLKLSKENYLRSRGWNKTLNALSNDSWLVFGSHCAYSTLEALTIQLARDAAIKDERWSQFFAAALSQEDMGDGGVVHHADGQDFYVRRAVEIADKALAAYIDKWDIEIEGA